MNRSLLIKFVILIIFVIIMSLPLIIFLEKKQLAEQQFRSVSTEKISDIKNSLQNIITSLESLEAFYDSSKFVDKNEYDLFLSGTFFNDNIAIAWLPMIENKDEAAHTFRNEVRTHSPDFRYKTLEIMAPDNDSAKYLLPVMYVFPEQDNKELIGQNIAANRVFSDSIDQVIRKAAPVVSPVINKEGSGFIFYPVYEINKSKIRNDRIKGFFMAVVDFNSIFGEKAEQYDDLMLDIKMIYDGIGNGQIDLYSNVEGEVASAPSFISYLFTGRLSFARSIQYLDKTILVNAYSKKDSFAVEYGEFFTVLFLSLLVFLLSLKFYNSEVKKSSMLQEKEKALSSANTELERRVEELMFARNELEKSHKEVERARDEAEGANRAKSDFLANMSHELRTPMHAIINYSEMGIGKLGKGEIEKLEKYLQNIKKSSSRLLKIINNLLDLSKLQAKAILLEPEKTDINEVLTDVLNELQPLLKEKNIDVSFESRTDSTIAIFDGEKIFHVIMNLLSNAIKFSDDNSTIDITLDETLIDFAEDQHKAICFSVRDSGVGVPEDEIETIFEKFVQSSKTRTGAGGTGLGLAISKEIIDAHRGKIWAENNISKGAKFSFILPRNFLG